MLKLIFIVLWFASGIIGYLMLRQGYLVRKVEEWDRDAKVAGLFLIFMGPFSIIVVLSLVGKDAFKSREKIL